MVAKKIIKDWDKNIMDTKELEKNANIVPNPATLRIYLHLINLIFSLFKQFKHIDDYYLVD